MKVLFAHGFEGSNTGSKPTYLSEILGYDVSAPVLHTNGWTIEDEVGVLLKALDDNKEIEVLVGSSMGGLASAIASARRPERDLKLILLAPAFDLHILWENGAGGDGILAWEREGSAPYFHHGIGQEIMLPWAFMETARAVAGIHPVHPTVIIHGSGDDVVPISHSRAVSEACEMVRELLEVDDGHRLQYSLHCLNEAFEILRT